jgi:hypothetical protein
MAGNNDTKKAQSKIKSPQTSASRSFRLKGEIQLRHSTNPIIFEKNRFSSLGSGRFLLPKTLLPQVFSSTNDRFIQIPVAQGLKPWVMD